MGPEDYTYDPVTKDLIIEDFELYICFIEIPVIIPSATFNLSNYLLKDSYDEVEINFSYGGNDWDFVGFKFLYSSDDLQLAEHHIYGSGANGRIAISKPSNMDYESSTINETTTFARILGEKYYELKDHLGNIRITLNDYKTEDNKTVISTINTNYPYGMNMPAMNYNSSDSRYGFNSIENDNEIAGQGNILSAYFRNNDVRGIRWWSQDPKAQEFADQSPYVSMGNNPVNNIDPLGDQKYPWWGPGSNPMFSIAEGFRQYFQESIPIIYSKNEVETSIKLLSAGNGIAKYSLTNSNSVVKEFTIDFSGLLDIPQKNEMEMKEWLSKVEIGETTTQNDNVITHKIEMSAPLKNGIVAKGSLSTSIDTDGKITTSAEGFIGVGTKTKGASAEVGGFMRSSQNSDGEAKKEMGLKSSLELQVNEFTTVNISSEAGLRFESSKKGEEEKP